MEHQKQFNKSVHPGFLDCPSICNASIDKTGFVYNTTRATFCDECEIPKQERQFKEDCQRHWQNFEGQENFQIDSILDDYHKVIRLERLAGGEDAISTEWTELETRLVNIVRSERFRLERIDNFIRARAADQAAKFAK